MAITLKANVRWGGVDYAPGATIPGLTPSDEAGLVSSNRAEWVGTPSTTSNAAVPVMATTSPGGVVRNSLGELLWRPGWNQLVRKQPQLVARVADRDGVQQYTNTSFTGGGSAAIDTATTDPATGLPMLTLNMPAGGANQYQNVTWEALAPIQMADNDVWIVTAFVPNDVTDANIALILSPDPTVGSNWRRLTFQGTHAARLSRGWNVLICLNNEARIDNSTYGVLGTTQYMGYETAGTVSPDMTVRSIRVRASKTAAPAETLPIRIGSVHIARAGWCTAAMMWSADDVPRSFIDLAVPIIESYGWRTTLNAVSTYAEPGNPTYASVETLRALSARGHEIWSHTRTHENMADVVNKARAVQSPANFWRANGLPSAAQYMAWPFGAYNADAIAAAKAAGYKIARAIVGASNPWLPALNPYTYPAYTPEVQNPWQADAQINGTILRGQSMFTYMHATIEGGAGINAYPAAAQHYADHLRRWCDLVASHESAGRCVVLTGTEYFNACGIDPATMPFYETI